MVQGQEFPRMKNKLSLIREKKLCLAKCTSTFSGKLLNNFTFEDFLSSIHGFWTKWADHSMIIENPA